MQTGTDYFYPEHGEGYMLKIGSARDIFWVFNYDSLRPQVSDIAVEQSCERTVLSINGAVPAMEYRRMNGSLSVYPRMCRVSYVDASWDDGTDMWIDSTAVAEMEFTTMLAVDASAVPTDYVISDVLAEDLGLKVDTLYTPIYQPVALNAHPQTITTTRGSKGETSNEVNRPYDEDDINITVTKDTDGLQKLEIRINQEILPIILEKVTDKTVKQLNDAVTCLKTSYTGLVAFFSR